MQGSTNEPKMGRRKETYFPLLQSILEDNRACLVDGVLLSALKSRLTVVKVIGLVSSMIIKPSNNYR